MTYPEMSMLVRCSGHVMLLVLLTEMELVCSNCVCLCVFVGYLQHATERLLFFPLCYRARLISTSSSSMQLLGTVTPCYASAAVALGGIMHMS